MLTQLRYRGHGEKPTRKQIREWGEEWVRTGKTPEGVTIEPICWAKNPPKDLRKWLRTHGVYYGKAGLVKCYGGPDTTLCDYDNERGRSVFWIYTVARTLGIKPLVIQYDRTARGWHVRIRWNRNFSPVQRIAIQAILGSDHKREMLNLSRVLSGRASNERWNLLFKEKLV